MDSVQQFEHESLFYLITYPRSCSNLFLHMIALDEQPSVYPAADFGGYFFMSFFRDSLLEGLWTTHVDQLSDEQAAKMKQRALSGAENLGQHVAKARSLQKKAVVKEHATFICNPVAVTKFLHGSESTTQEPWIADPGATAFDRASTSDQNCSISPGNETILPDQFLRTLKPIFLIRNPLAAFPSFLRAIKDFHGVHDDDDAVNRVSLTLHWNRSLYDWYVQQLQSSTDTQKGSSSKGSDVPWPIILDADDIMREPKVLVRFCEIVDLDPTMIRYSWDAASKERVESLDQSQQRMLSTLLASSGIDKSKFSDELSIESEAPKWREEFGEEDSAALEKLVRAAMPDYEYMKQRRLRPVRRSDGLAS